MDAPKTTAAPEWGPWEARPVKLHADPFGDNGVIGFSIERSSGFIVGGKPTTLTDRVAFVYPIGNPPRPDNELAEAILAVLRKRST